MPTDFSVFAVLTAFFGFVDFAEYHSGWFL